MFSRLTRIQRTALLLFVFLVLGRMLAFAMHAAVPFKVGIPLSLLLLVLVFILIRPLIRMFLWRVRRRLLLTYFLIGVLPITLLAFFVLFAFNLVLSQTANYLLHAEIDQRIDRLMATAQLLGQEVSAHGAAGVSTPLGEQTFIRTGNHSPSEFPKWSAPGFKGILRNKEGIHFIAAHGSTGTGKQLAEVFLYQTLDNKTVGAGGPGSVHQ